MIKVMHISSEVAPFSKTGGLADVAYSLPLALNELDAEISIVTPLYLCIDREKFNLKKDEFLMDIYIGGKHIEVSLWTGYIKNKVPVYFIENDELYGREELYTTKEGDYPDNYKRFAVFSMAVFELLKRKNLSCDILHCHDWQSGLVPYYNHYHFFDFYKTVITIHNLGYQGIFSSEVIPGISLSWEHYNPEEIEFYGKINFLKAGILYSKKITTVSPQYAKEIQTKEFGYGLDGVLRKRQKDLIGILNGVDYTNWNPETDELIPEKFSPENLKGKEVCKRELQKYFNLPQKPEIPLFGIISRLAEQKGIDIVVSCFSEIAKLGVQFAILGRGDEKIEEALLNIKKKYPEKLGLKIGFDNPLAHLIEAGSDFFLMPSRYEPCGLNQLYSLKYGTIPVVHAVGGLVDSIKNFSPDFNEGTGFVFEELKTESLIEAIKKAIEVFKNKNLFKEIILRAMKQDFSWKVSAKKYFEIYKQLIE